MPNTYEVNLISEETGKEMAQALRAGTEAIMKIGNKMGAYDLPRSWQELQMHIQSGTVRQICPVGTKLLVDKESGVSATVHGSITGATVNEDMFIETIGHSGTAAYEFIYDGSAWHHNGEDVELTNYGITVTGTPTADDKVVVHVQASKIEFDVVDIDYDVPVNDALEHTLALWTSDLLLYGLIPFCPAQKLVYVAEALSAGTYNITLDHGAYGGGTAQDGTYQFTTTQEIPAGGGIRHTSMGMYQGGGYNKEQITAGTFITYDASYNVIEQGLVCTEGSGGTSLGTTTASNPTYKTEAKLNFTERQFYGSNRWLHSSNKEWLNSDAPGAASGQIASWWKASDEFDMPVRSTLPGFLHGLDPAFRAIMQKVRKRTAKCIADGYSYEDTEELVFEPSMTELGYGKNNNISETAAKADGTLKTELAWDMFIGASNDDRIRYHSGTAKYYWLRSPNPSYASSERLVIPSGALGSDYAGNASGVSAGLCLG